jgi:N-acetylmuramoyl-L-alanine amidase
MKILLDNGHGYNTKGKRSPIWDDESQLLEFEFTRSVVAIIDAQLKLKGYDSIVLVPELIDISLSERVIRANKYDDAILISIHGNAHGVEDANGFEVFTHENASPVSEDIAKIIWDEFNNHSKFTMRADWSDNNPDKEARFTILNSKHPSVLTESGFYTNKRDCYYMMSVYGQNEIAAIHTEALIKFINKL